MADGAEELSLEARLARAERSLAAHDFLLRAVLTHLAITDPTSYGALIGGFTRSRLYKSPGTAGDLTREVTEQLTAMLEDIAASLPHR